MKGGGVAWSRGMAVRLAIFHLLLISEAAISGAIPFILLFFSSIAWGVCVFFLLFSIYAGLVCLCLHLFPAISR